VANSFWPGSAIQQVKQSYDGRGRGCRRLPLNGVRPNPMTRRRRVIDMPTLLEIPEQPAHGLSSRTPGRRGWSSRLHARPVDARLPRGTHRVDLHKTNALSASAGQQEFRPAAAVTGCRSVRFWSPCSRR